jgi:hypothetical protein
METMNRAMVVTVALAALSFVCAERASAQSQVADPGPTGVLRVGKLYSFGGGADLQHGFGMDLRYQVYPDRALDGYVGAFGQAQYELGDAWRFDGGITGGWGFFGLELGVSHRTATATYAGSTGLHVGQSFTFGPLSVGARLTIPLVDYVPQNVASPPSVQGIEGAVTVTLGWGFTVHGKRRAGGCHAHRMHAHH